MDFKLVQNKFLLFLLFFTLSAIGEKPIVKDHCYGVVRYYQGSAGVTGQKPKPQLIYYNDKFLTETSTLTCENASHVVDLDALQYAIPAYKEDYCQDTTKNSKDCTASEPCNCCEKPSRVCTKNSKFSDAAYKSCRNQQSCMVNVTSIYMRDCKGKDYDCEDKKCHSRWVEVKYYCRTWERVKNLGRAHLGTNQREIAAIAGSMIGGALLVILIVSIRCYCMHRKKKEKKSYPVNDPEHKKVTKTEIVKTDDVKLTNNQSLVSLENLDENASEKHTNQVYGRSKDNFGFDGPADYGGHGIAHGKFGGGSENSQIGEARSLDSQGEHPGGVYVLEAARQGTPMGPEKDPDRERPTVQLEEGTDNVKRKGKKNYYGVKWLHQRSTSSNPDDPVSGEPELMRTDPVQKRVVDQKPIPVKSPVLANTKSGKSHVAANTNSVIEMVECEVYDGMKVEEEGTGNRGSVAERVKYFGGFKSSPDKSKTENTNVTAQKNIKVIKNETETGKTEIQNNFSGTKSGQNAKPSLPVKPKLSKTSDISEANVDGPNGPENSKESKKRGAYDSVYGHFKAEGRQREPK